MYCTMTYEITMNFPHHLPTTNPCSFSGDYFLHVKD